MTPRTLTPQLFFRRLALGLAAFFSALVVPALAQTSGVVAGQVRNASTNAYLDGVVVEVEGTGRTVLTDREGRYELTLPAGMTTLVARYTGLEAEKITVDVRPGARVTQNFALNAGIYKLEAYTVSGPREGSAAAITRQREAPNVKNVVASDSFGNIADGNIGDLLQQLPGITAVYVGADVRSVQIRGIDGALNSVTMDGDRIASSQSANAGRTFEFEQASLNNIETIEVTKAPTPDMDADSIGGNVNIVSKSAFDRNQPRTFNYSIGGVWRPKYYTRSDNWLREPIDNVGPSLNFNYQDRLGADKRIGVVLTATYHSQPGGDTAALMNYQAALVEPYYVQNVSVPRPAGAPRTRLATGAKIDYKLSEHTTLTFNSAYNWFHETNDTRAMLLGTTANVANFRPGYTSYFEEVLANANSSSAITLSTDDKSGRTFQFVPSVKHRFAGLEIDYGASFSNSQTYYDYSANGRHFQSRPKATITYRLPSIGFTIDRRQSLKWPQIVQTAGPDLYNLDNYGTLLVTQPDREGEDEIMTAKLNVKKTLDLAAPSYLKLGGTFRQQDRQLMNRSRRYNYVGADGVQNSSDDNLAQFLDPTPKWSDSNAGYRQPPWANPFAVARHQALLPGLWREDVPFGVNAAAAGDRGITEQVLAGYVMGHTKLNAFSILGGVRVEQTKTDAEGPLQLSNGTVIGRQRREGDYVDLFPGVHFRYAPNRNLLARLSYSNGIGRPSFENLMPLDSVNETAQTVNTRNAALRPQYSDNFDATVEYYFEPVGMLTASVFLKEVNDFQFTDSSQLVPAGADNGFGGLYEGYRITTTRNGGSARYRGFELAYQQQFTFLPGFWRGFGFSANYTQLSTKGDYGGASATTLVAGFVPKAGNVAVTYLGHGFNIRLNAVWRGTYLVGSSATPALLRYSEPKFQVNLKTKYSYSPRLGFFCDIENLNKSPITETYFVTKDRPAETRIVVAKVVAGVTGRF
ncbi:TonB-dependent receptor [Horticoccus sp. 23ND18S-11]|uniref:TonB-dependent receptor n=1 Tax=Horticoccus sp. 23ND18S-11 TaxID=3391832 RepID=UPI0039C9008B